MRVLHVIKTVSMKSDGRLQKWVKFLDHNSSNSTVFILEDENGGGCGMEYDAEVVKTSLISRKLFSQRSGYPIKIPEYLFRFLKFIKGKASSFDLIVFHDVQQYLNLAIYIALFKNKTKIVWDLHELPHPITYRATLFKNVLARMMSSVDCLIYTNSERKSFINEKFGNREKAFFILNNYPDKTFNCLPTQTLPVRIVDWLKDEKYILWLGVANRVRNFQTFFSIYKRFYAATMKLIIIGKIDREFTEETDGLITEGRVFQAYVRQEEIIRYIDHAYFSVVLYNTSSANNRYCEPNRLYQLINRRIPVIVGNNPTLRNLVNRLDVGVVLMDDGSSEAIMKEAFEKLITDYDHYRKNLHLNLSEETFCVDSQFDALIQQLKRL